MSSRGFKKLVGKTIVSVDTSAVNEVVITDSDGKKFSIIAEVGELGIPHVFLEKYKPTKFEPVTEPFPYPEKHHDYD